MNITEAIKQLTPAERQEMIEDLVSYAEGFIRFNAEGTLDEPELFEDCCDTADLRKHIFGAVFDCIEFDAEDGYAGKCEAILQRHIKGPQMTPLDENIPNDDQADAGGNEISFNN